MDIDNVEMHIRLLTEQRDLFRSKKKKKSSEEEAAKEKILQTIVILSYTSGSAMSFDNRKILKRPN